MDLPKIPKRSLERIKRVLYHLWSQGGRKYRSRVPISVESPIIMMRSLKEAFSPTLFSKNSETPCHFWNVWLTGPLVACFIISWHQRRRRRRPRVFSSSSLCYSSSYVQNYMSKSGSLHVTVYFPIVIDICGIFRLCSISIGMSTVSTVQERCMVVTPTFWQEVLHLRGAVGKRTWLNHSRSSPTPPLMSGDDRKHYEDSNKSSPKVPRCL